jgi:hypothetical protein
MNNTDTVLTLSRCDNAFHSVINNTMQPLSTSNADMKYIKVLNYFFLKVPSKYQLIYSEMFLQYGLMVLV